METLPSTKSCFVCGKSNPSGLKLSFETDGTTVRARFTPQLAHVGFRNTVHGGIISAVLDEVMVWACGIRTKRFAVCAELNVRFLQPARPGQDLVIVGELVSNRRNRIFEARAELRAQANQVLATASGKYLPIKEANRSALLDDFESGSQAVEKLFG